VSALATLSALGRRRRSALSRAFGPRHELLSRVLPAGRRRLARAAFVLGLVSLALGWLEARRVGQVAPTAATGADWVLCLDVSRSMWARDVLPDRLARARGEVRGLLEVAGTDRVALVAFAGSARLVSPLTTDHAALRALLEGVDPTLPLGGGTDLGAALEEAERALASAPPGARVVVVTDGEDLAGRARLLAERLHGRGARVDCVGVGTREGGKIALEGEGSAGFLVDRSGSEVVSALSPDTLERLAEAGGGRFLVAQGDGAALRDLRAPGGHAGPAGGEGARGRAFLLLALLLLALDLGLKRGAAR